MRLGPGLKSVRRVSINARRESADREEIGLQMNGTGAKNSKLILAAMIFAVAMTFIDQTIVAIAIPTI